MYLCLEEQKKYENLSVLSHFALTTWLMVEKLFQQAISKSKKKGLDNVTKAKHITFLSGLFEVI